jgi:hypothetical protein
MASQIANNIPSSLTGSDLGVSATYFGTVFNSYIIKDYDRQVYKMYGTDRLTNWIDMNSTPTFRRATTFYHVEEGRIQEALVANAAAAAAGAGLPVTITLTAGSLVGGTKSPVAVGFQIVFKDGSVGQISAVPSESTLTIEPALATQTISVAQNEQFIFIPVSYVGEGSCAGNSGLRYPPVEFSNTMVTARLDETITDEMFASFSEQVRYIDFYDPKTDSTVKCWTTSMLDNRWVQFHNGRELAGLLGKSFTNTTLSTTAGIKGTTGLIPSIQSYGNIQPYAAVAGFQITDLEDMTITMEKNHSPSEYAGWIGIELNRDFQKATKDWFTNTGTTFGAFGGSQDMAKMYGFNSISVMNRTFHMHNMDVFNNPAYLGAAGFNYIGGGIFLPMTSTLDGNSQPMQYIKTVRLQNSSCNVTFGYDHSVVDGTGFVNPSEFRPTSCRRAVFTWVDKFGWEITGAKAMFLVQRS